MVFTRTAVLALSFPVIFLGFLNYTLASNDSRQIPIQNIGLGTYYVMVNLPGVADEQFMIDTGSGYATINQKTLDILKTDNKARYVKNIKGVLANGKTQVVPIWRVSQLTVNKQCTLRDIEVAVFPGKTRQILGLSALKKVAPFAMSFDPPQLTLSQCG